MQPSQQHERQQTLQSVHTMIQHGILVFMSFFCQVNGKLIHDSLAAYPLCIKALAPVRYPAELNQNE